MDFSKLGPAEYLQELQNLHTDCSKLWLESEQCKEVTDFFQESILPLQTLKIDQAICIGLGRFSKGYFWQVSMMQFVAFEYWIKLLKSRPGGLSIRVVFQEMVFDPEDIAFIISRGYEVVGSWTDRRRAQLLTTPTTFLFAPVGNEGNLILQCLKTAHPALLIGHAFHPRRHIDQLVEDPKGDVYFKQQNKWYRRISHETGRLACDFENVTSPRYTKKREMRLRRRTRPFLSTRLFLPLFTFTNNPSRFEYSPHLADSRAEQLPFSLRWVRVMWVFYRPDNRSRLTMYNISDDIECPCFHCWKHKAYVSRYNRPWRAPSPIRDEDEAVPEWKPEENDGIDPMEDANWPTSDEDERKSTFRAQGTSETGQSNEYVVAIGGKNGKALT